MSMKEYNVVVGNTKEKEEVQDLFEKLGYEKGFFMDSDYPRCVVTQESKEKWVTTGMDMGYATGKRLTIQELRDMTHPKEREYLNKTTGEYRKTAENVTGKQWVEMRKNTNMALGLHGGHVHQWFSDDKYIVGGKIADCHQHGYGTFSSWLDGQFLWKWQRHTLPEALPLIDDEDFVFTPSAPLDTQVGGNHYKDCAIQPVEFAMKNNLDFCQASAIKYIVRHASKNGKQDLEKAKHFIDLLIQFHYD